MLEGSGWARWKEKSKLIRQFFFFCRLETWKRSHFDVFHAWGAYLLKGKVPKSLLTLRGQNSATGGARRVGLGALERKKQAHTSIFFSFVDWRPGKGRILTFFMLGVSRG